MGMVLDSTHFISVPWKNGAGTTLELFRIPHPDVESQFLFRISMAQIEQSGPFSSFPNINRILFLTEGEGFILSDEAQPMYIVDEKFDPIRFRGELNMTAKLINGPCTDFNIMTDRNWGECQIEFEQLQNGEEKIYHSSEHLFLYIHRSTSPELIVLKKNESHSFKADQDLTLFKIDLILK